MSDVSSSGKEADSTLPEKKPPAAKQRDASLDEVSRSRQANETNSLKNGHIHDGNLYSSSSWQEFRADVASKASIGKMSVIEGPIQSDQFRATVPSEEEFRANVASKASLGKMPAVQSDQLRATTPSEEEFRADVASKASIGKMPVIEGSIQGDQQSSAAPLAKQEVNNTEINTTAISQGQKAQVYFQEAEEILNTIPIGKAALQVDVQVVLDESKPGPTRFEPSSNTVHINTEQFMDEGDSLARRTARVGLDYVLETQLAKEYHAEQAAGKLSLTLPEYLDKRIEQKAEAMASYLDAKGELEQVQRSQETDKDFQGPKIDVVGMSHPLSDIEERYKATVESSGREEGVKLLAESLKEGEFKTPEGELYRDQFTRYWQEMARDPENSEAKLIKEQRETFLPSENQIENKQFKRAMKDIAREIGRRLNRSEQRRLHDAITKQGYDYQEIVEIGISMFKKGETTIDDTDDSDYEPGGRFGQFYEWE